MSISFFLTYGNLPDCENFRSRKITAAGHHEQAEHPSGSRRGEFKAEINIREITRTAAVSDGIISMHA
jgi:hypothetical protein